MERVCCDARSCSPCHVIYRSPTQLHAYAKRLVLSAVCPALLAAQKSKDCPFLIKKGMKGPSGNATWAIPEGVPDSTIYVRAYAMCAHGDGPLVKCAYGNSPGFIQVSSALDTCPALYSHARRTLLHSPAGIQAEGRCKSRHARCKLCSTAFLSCRRSRRSTTPPRT